VAPKILCVIPSRLQSTRLPRKPLAIIDTKPMVQWVYDAAQQSQLFDEIIVATDSSEIETAVHSFGGKAMMTPAELQTGTDRVAFVAQNFPSYDVIVNLQGDQPFVTKESLEALIKPYLENRQPHMTTVGCPLKLASQHNDPNCVKVLLNLKKQAIYFSRSPIPYFRNKEAQNSPELSSHILQHLGLYAFEKNFLKIYPTLPQTFFELTESLEQLRVLENGFTIEVGFTNTWVPEINTPEDLVYAKEHVLPHLNQKR